MPKTKTAARRPEYHPGAGWCCRCCQEARQLQCLATMMCEPQGLRATAGQFLAHLSAVRDGQYGGVDVLNLFD